MIPVATNSFQSIIMDFIQKECPHTNHTFKYELSKTCINAIAAPTDFYLNSILTQKQLIELDVNMKILFKATIANFIREMMINEVAIFSLAKVVGTVEANNRVDLINRIIIVSAYPILNQVLQTIKTKNPHLLNIIPQNEDPETTQRLNVCGIVF